MAGGVFFYVYTVPNIGDEPKRSWLAIFNQLAFLNMAMKPKKVPNWLKHGTLIVRLIIDLVKAIKG